MALAQRPWPTERRMPAIDCADVAKMREALAVYMGDADRTAPAGWDTAGAFVEWLAEAAAERPYSIPAGRPGRRR